MMKHAILALLVVGLALCGAITVENSVLAVAPLAQVAPEPAPGPTFDLDRLIRESIVQLGNFAFLGGIVWYLLTKYQPRKDCELIAEREAFRQEAKDERVANRQVIDALVVHNKIVADSLVAQLDKQNATTMEVVRSCAAGRHAMEQAGK